MSDTAFTIRNPQHGLPLAILASSARAMGTAAYAIVREWWYSYRSRLELASYSHDQRKDLGFQLTSTAKPQSPSGRSKSDRLSADSSQYEPKPQSHGATRPIEWPLIHALYRRWHRCAGLPGARDEARSPRRAAPRQIITRSILRALDGADQDDVGPIAGVQAHARRRRAW